MNEKDTQKRANTFNIIKDIVLIAALFGAVTLFIDLKVSVAAIEHDVKELIQLHPRIQGGMTQ